MTSTVVLVGIGLMVALVVLAMSVWLSGSGTSTTLSGGDRTSSGQGSADSPSPNTPPAPVSPGGKRERDGGTASSRPSLPDLSAAELFAKKSPAVVRIEIVGRSARRNGLGTGFLVTADGIVVTNHHVVRDAASITAIFPDGRTVKTASLVATDASADLAVLKIEGNGYVSLELVSAPPPIGSKVYAIGNPVGLTNTISDGLLSGIRTIPGRGEFLQTTAAISPGSSGGPLLASDGTVVGVTTMILPAGQNLNFAVPSARVLSLLGGGTTASKVTPDSASSSGEATGTGADVRLPPVPKSVDPAAARVAGDTIQQAYDLIQAGETARAIALLESARGSLSADPKFHFALGYALGRAKRYQDAIDSYRRAVALDPTDAVCWYNLAVNLDALDRPDDAIQAYRSAIKCDSSYHKARLRLAADLQRVGKATEAAVILEEVIHAAPQSPEGKAARAALDRRR